MRKNDEGEWEWSDDGECADDAKPKASAAASVCIIGQLSLAILLWGVRAGLSIVPVVPWEGPPNQLSVFTTLC